MSVAIDDAVAADYSDHIGPSLLATTATLMALAGIRVGESVLDIGCGPGLLTLPAAAAAASTGRVIGVDANPAMLARAAARRSPATDAAPITWLHAAESAIPVADSSMDKVVSGLKLQYAGDVGAVVQEVCRVLRPGGRLSVSTWDTTPTDEREAAVLEVFERYGLRDACARRTELTADGTSVAPAELPALLETAGLHVTHVADGVVTLPFVDAVEYARWRLSLPATVATLVGRADAPDIRADVLQAVGAHDGGAPVILALPVRYAVSHLR